MKVVITYDDVVEFFFCNENNELDSYTYDVILDVDVDDVEFAIDDIEKIVDEYIDDVVDYVVENYRDLVMKKLNGDKA